jgi:hypothetical protein
LKGRTIFTVAVMDEIVSGPEKAPLCHGFVARNLLHLGFIGMWRDAGNMDAATTNMQEK